MRPHSIIDLDQALMRIIGASRCSHDRSPQSPERVPQLYGSYNLRSKPSKANQTQERDTLSDQMEKAQPRQSRPWRPY
jgi:hypothetical protein